MGSFYITTAIDYANGKPHLGHAYEKVLTDVIARHRRLLGDRVHFLTGLDEHGQKVQQSAAKAGISEQAWCDQMAAQFQELCAKLLISNDDYIRTTEERHKAVVRDILQKLYDQGEIYKGQYRGFYSVRQEQFVLEKEKVEGKWPEIYGEVTEIAEENYYFRLSNYQDWLVDFLKSNDFIFPRFRQKQVLEFLKEPINDLCISRPKERLAWGIPLPFDEGYVTYVWFDALLNYISAVGYGTDRFGEFWPAAYNVIGKDIIVPSHAVYWPIMLKACGVEPPKSLLAHGWWHLGGQKISKSTGVVMDPLALVDKFGADAFRYFVTREMNVGQDSDFTVDLFLARYNGDLANDLGNLVSRLLNMGGRYFPDGLPSASVEESPETVLQDLWERSKGLILEHCEGLQFHSALDQIFQFIKGINRYAETRKPWSLAKSGEEDAMVQLETAIATMAEGLRLSAVALNPVMPEVSGKILALLGERPIDLWEGHLDWSQRLKGNVLGGKTILFPKPQLEEVGA